MTFRSYLTIANALLIGGVIGWFARTHTLDDRYILSLALKHETSARYFNTKLDSMIQENERSFKHGK